MSKRHPPEVREKALRLALDHLDEYPSAHAAAQAIGPMVDADDNALAESTIGLFKTEVVKRHDPFKTLAEVEFALMEWVDWYNNALLHSRLGYLTPAEYESAYYAQDQSRRPALD